MGSVDVLEIPTDTAIWDRFFMVAPLAIVGTRDGDGHDLAPKHQAMPLGRENFFCFVCTPSHATYRNVREHGEFTVSFPRPDQLMETSLAAHPRRPDGWKPGLESLPTRPARVVQGVLVEGCSLGLECALDRILDGYGDDSLIVGRVVAASASASSLRSPDVDDLELLHASPLLAYLPPGRFAAISSSLSFPFPAGFRR